MLSAHSGFDPKAAASLMEMHGLPPVDLIFHELQDYDDAALERIICNAMTITAYDQFGKDMKSTAGTIRAIRKEIRTVSREIRKESEEKLMRMERSYTAIFAVFTVIVFALAGGIFIAMAGIGISYSDGDILHLRTAILIIGAFFLTVLSIIIKLISSLVPPMKEKEKRSLPARIIAALKQPITIAMLFLIVGIVTSDVDNVEADMEKRTGSAVQNTLSNVIPIAEDILIDL